MVLSMVTSIATQAMISRCESITKQFSIMKKTCLIFIALAAVSCAVALGNTLENKVAVIRTGEVFKVIFKSPEESIVQVTILDTDRTPLFTEKIISRGEFIRPYNLSQLPKGDYKICIDDQNGEHIEKICSTESAVASSSLDVGDNVLMAHVLKIKGADNKYLVAIPRQGETEAEIHIYDQYDQLIYSEKLKLNSDFAKVYALQNLERATFGFIGQFSGKEKLFRIE